MESILFALLLAALSVPSSKIVSVAPATSAPITRATVGAGCYGSRAQIGTGNEPLGSGRATTVVNIWAVLRNDSRDRPRPIAWIFKNASGEFWIQVSLAKRDVISQAFPPSLVMTFNEGRPREDPISVPRRMPKLTAYDGYFARIQAVRQACFNGDLPERYY